MEHEHLLYDGITGLPTLQAAVESMRRVIVERGELLILYFNFSRYSKIEEIYGWEKLDAVLATTAAAVRAYLHDSPLRSSRVMVRYANDDDFVFFHIPEPGFEAAGDEQITEIISGLQKHVSERIEAAHGEDIASLFDIYAGRSHVMVNPKFRLERQIYRGVRQAVLASQSLEARETVKKLEDLRESIRTRGVYVDYHPIVVAETGEVFGYEALARGVMRSMRSPEVMFEVAARGDLLWELSRICRSRAIEGMHGRFDNGELLFLNVDPGDFADPTFSPEQLDAPDPTRVVIEITERTAIKDYPKFRNRLQAFRDAGFRFAVDDAG
ncbi:MAG: EAL domain-containing protein, partial [Gemmatimonadota bacterium]|nr:EAL domain-containing protein [Gemmatimonadota bacterium]